MVTPGQRQGPGSAGSVAPPFKQADTQAIEEPINGLKAVAPSAGQSVTVVAMAKNWSTTSHRNNQWLLHSRPLDPRLGPGVHREREASSGRGGRAPGRNRAQGAVRIPGPDADSRPSVARPEAGGRSDRCARRRKARPPWARTRTTSC